MKAAEVFTIESIDSAELRESAIGLAGSLLYDFEKGYQVSSNEVRAVNLLLLAAGIQPSDVDRLLAEERTQRLEELNRDL
jgi:hypothetical protein